MLSNSFQIPMNIKMFNLFFVYVFLHFIEANVHLNEIKINRDCISFIPKLIILISIKTHSN